MAVSTKRFGLIEQVATERACGGWLVVSAPGSILKVGATGESRTEALNAFERAVRRFELLLDEHYLSQNSR